VAEDDLKVNQKERLLQRLIEMERAYHSVLTKALSDCAAGRWGLFGHNEHLFPTTPPAELGELRALALDIARVRKRTGHAPFELHQQFEAARGRVGPNDPGEPKQANEWLRRLTSA